MTKRMVEKLITTKELALLIKRTESAVTKAARVGTFGDTVQRGPRGEYLFRWPAAREAWRQNTDTTRARPEHIDEAPRVHVYESPRGRLAISDETYNALIRASDHFDAPLMSPELVRTLDAILWITQSVRLPDGHPLLGDAQ